MLRAHIARKDYPTSACSRRLVLDDLALTVEAGEILAILGASGSGKTTLLRIIAGLDSNFEGRLDWAAADPPRIGMAFQEPRLLPWLTVAQNLALVCEDDAGLGRIEPVLAALGLAGEGDTVAGSLSLGMARRLAIARVFVVEPALILLDEPFASLDEANARRARDLLLEMWQERPTTVILITHQLAEAAALADRIVTLAGTPAKLTAEFVVPPDLRRAGPAAAEIVVERLRKSS